MSILETARAGILEQPAHRLHKILFSIAGGIIVASGLLVWYHIHTINTLQQRLRTINTQRRQAQNLFTRYQNIQKQKEQVNSVLEQDKDFKIKEYMTDRINELQFPSNTYKLEVSKPRDIQNGYKEVSLDANFTKVTTKQLVTLMHEAEKNERVYIKSVTISQQKQVQKIDATLTVATLHIKES